MNSIRSFLAAFFLLLVLTTPVFGGTPYVSATTPASNTTNVGINDPIVLTFSEEITWDSVFLAGEYRINIYNNSTNAKFTLFDITPAANSDTFTLTPTASLQSNTTYRVEVSYLITSSSSGTQMGSDSSSTYTFYFTTENNTDTVHPTVSPSYPAASATGIPQSTTVIAQFSEAINPLTINGTTFYLKTSSGSSVSGTVSYDSSNYTATFTPNSTLASNTTYTATITTGVTDLVANTLEAAYSWSFTTVTTDSTAPTIKSVYPVVNATSVPISAAVVVKFSKAMLSSTITTSTFYINGVSGSVSYDSSTNSATFTPTAALSYATDYTVYVKTGITDTSANSLQSAKIWTFTTAKSTSSTTVDNYAQVPTTTATTSVQPNVLLIVDNSGSMYEFAYKTIGKGGSPGSGADSSYTPSTSYYGYFDNTAMYSYNSLGYFTTSSATLNKTSFWSGNFLNWLTMRRVDVLRKVLIGGKITPRTAGSANYLLPVTGNDRDYYKAYNGTYYKISTANSSDTVPTINVCSTSACTTASSSYKTKIYYGTTVPTDGIIQTYANKVRMGMMKFNTTGAKFESGSASEKDGGYLVAALGSPQADLITAIEAANPKSNTPLAETFYEAIRYFQATNSAYNPGTSYSSIDPIQYSCQKNFVIILTDGEATKDFNIPGHKYTDGKTETVADSYGFNVKTWLNAIENNESLATNSLYTMSYHLAGLAYYAHNTDLRSSSIGASFISGIQNLTTYTVFLFDNSTTGASLLRYTAKYGGYSDNDNNGKPYTDSTCSTSSAKASCSEWTSDGTGTPNNYFKADDGDTISNSLNTAFNNILAKVSSGTAASILSNSEGSGAILLQGLYYPTRTFDSSTYATWVGEVQGLWYYLDPYLNTSIRVDTTRDFKLNTKQDYIADFYFDSSDKQTKVQLYKDVNGDGNTLTASTLTTPDDMTNVSSLWRAGYSLWARNLTSDPRTIYTHTGISTLDSVTDSNSAETGMALFTSSNLSINTSVRTWLQVANTTEATKLINYVRGRDQSGYRSRTVTISSCGLTDTQACTREWKLGDIVSSTPKIAAGSALNSYHKSASVGYGDTSYSKFIASSNYSTRGMAYVGGNDGMLHAFKLGKLNELTDSCRLSGVDSTTCTYDKANILDDSGNVYTTSTTTLGHEEWAYIPKQMLPYLIYLTDTDYPHLFYVDGTPKIVDVSVNTPSSYNSTDYPNCSSSYWLCPKQTVYSSSSTKTLSLENTSWRTILIVGTGLGGASRNNGDTCYTSGSGNCVNTPVPSMGYSSYTALDVTTPLTPKFMWEFYGDTTSGYNLGYTTGGPAIVRVGDRGMNGRWFAVFASGPTGPVDTSTTQFLGRSDQPLRIFIVDIATGTLIRTITTSLTNAFAGSLSSATVDTDRSNISLSGNYQDDAIYIGYTQYNNSSSSWNKGGVLRLLTKQSTDPADWILSTLISDIGPVTSSVTKLQDRTSRNLWLYFGTGRYFFKNSSTIDDQTSLRYLYGVKEPCYTSSNTLNTACTDSLNTSLLQDETAITPFDASKSGWYIQLLAAGTGTGAERVITDPVASSNGVVYYTTFAPSSDTCGYGGNSYLWAVNYSTGGLPASNALNGKLLLQTSTGAFAQVSTSSTFTSSRKSSAIVGIPPLSSGLNVTSRPRPVKRFLHIQEL